MENILHRYSKLLDRDFKAEKTNQKWATDISYINTKQGVLYLSVIRDLYDNSCLNFVILLKNFLFCCLYNLGRFKSSALFFPLNFTIDKSLCFLKPDSKGFDIKHFIDSKN